jgi:seryl-tRNA synthetase
MHDIKWIRENKDAYDVALSKRGMPGVSNKILELDEDKRQIVTLIQKLQKSRNDKTALFAKIKNHNSLEFSVLKKDIADIKEKLSELDERLNSETDLEKILETLPNIPDDSVPVGKDETSNVEVRSWGQIKKFDFTPKDHVELGESLGMIDFTKSVKMSGSRFTALLSDIAKLERALANFMLDLHTKEFGFTEVAPPYLVKDHAMFGAGQLPKFADDSFVTTNGYRLIPTSEVSLVNFAADEILAEEVLPLRLTAYTPCFRSEAGAAGKDTKGMFRVHQFNKIELVSICHPSKSEEEHQLITSAAEEVLKRLELPYRVMLLSTGDMGFTASKTYDLEVWLPGQNKYREISSCSNCTSFQARRMKAKFKSKETGTNDFVHTLNGSGVALGRCLIAIIENYQNADGSITVPKVLRSFMGKDVIVPKSI